MAVGVLLQCTEWQGVLQTASLASGVLWPLVLLTRCVAASDTHFCAAEFLMLRTPGEAQAVLVAAVAQAAGRTVAVTHMGRIDDTSEMNRCVSRMR